MTIPTGFVERKIGDFGKAYACNLPRFISDLYLVEGLK
jgi:hypothetical protein